MRAIWKGNIRFSLVTIPVRVYTATDSGQAISFNLLSKEGHNPVTYEKKDKVTGQPLKSEDIVKGYQYEPGQYVIIDDEDFAKVRLKSTKVVEIEGFVAANEVHPTLLDSPYFLGPDGEVAAKTYALLAETLKETGRVGVGRIVLRDRETVVLLTPEKKGILMYKLRYPGEVRSINEVPQLLENVQVETEQLKLSKMLVESMAKSFSEIPMKDNYQDALREMIEAKIAGKEIVALKQEEAPVVDIMAALKASIEQAKKKPMEKAMGSAAKAEKEATHGAKAEKAKRKAS